MTEETKEMREMREGSCWPGGGAGVAVREEPRLAVDP